MPCIAIKTTGDTCNKRCQEGQTRCKIHVNSLEKFGPHKTARRELKFLQKAEIQRMEHQRFVQTLELRGLERHRLYDEFRYRLTALKIQHQRAMELLIYEQEDHVRNTGINPDAEAERIQQENANRRRERQRQLEADNAEHVRNANLRAQQHQNLNNIQAEYIEINVVAQQPNRELANFVRDNQNVHTTVAVNQTKEMVNKILNIQVPQEYRWNMNICSKTPGEIITTCKLTPKAAWQMSAKYCQDEDIYDLGKGIYGKVLDGVWQYASQSESKEDICRSLKQEMEDNIGMCAQGNLSRLCNILAGYMEGIGSQESYSEILQRKIPKLMEVENLQHRIVQAYAIFIETGTPEKEWDTWLDPLVEAEDDVEYYKIHRTKDKNNNITGLEIKFYGEGQQISLADTEDEDEMW